MAEELQAGFYDCEVLQAGPATGDDGGGILIKLKFQFTEGDQAKYKPQKPYYVNWFRAHPSVQKEMLAVALAAITSGMHVQAVLESIPVAENADSYGQILRLYLKRW